MFTTVPAAKSATANHPEIPDGVAFQAIPLHYRKTTPPQEPTPKPSPWLSLAFGAMLLLGGTVLGFTMYNAGVAAGRSGSANEIAALESEAADTNAEIKRFCEGFQ